MRFLQRVVALIVLGSLFAIPLPADAQYFGRNKVTYDNFDFQKLETEHFTIFYYPEMEEAIEDAARMAERWYTRHVSTFNHTFEDRKPLILYANDTDFQQTNVVNQVISQGVGGLTEGRRERVVMPFTGDYAQFDHVLGHELVHSFQFDIALNSENGFNPMRLPLWLVEGMAEYLTLGGHHPFTAMWMRDAVLRDDLPSFRALNNPRAYFPYRFGHAFLAYVGGKYGDQAVPNLYRVAGLRGVESAFPHLFGISADSLVKEWREATKEAFAPLVADRTPADSAGRRVLARDIDAGNLNIAPTMSPDGRFVAFLSERDIFNINLFVADAQTGNVIADLGNAGRRSHFEELRFLESAGTWDPSGERLAFATFARGGNELAIWHVSSGRIESTIAVDDVPALRNPAWSPDGSRIAFSGIRGGLSDLYVLDLETNEVKQLTNDRYAYFQPSWSPDGRTLVFTTDRGVTDLATLDASSRLQIGRIDVESGDIQTDAPFPGAQHHNAEYSPDGQSLYFISDQDGFRDIYRWDLDDGRLYRVTRLQTGVSGITALAPALSVAAQSGRVMFTVFADGRHTGYSLEAEEAQGTLIEPGDIAGLQAPPSQAAVRAASLGHTLLATSDDDDERAKIRKTPGGMLPPHGSIEEGAVASYLGDPERGLPVDSEMERSPYSGRLSLEGIIPPRAGVSVGGPFGTQVAGGVGFRFGDMLGDQQLDVSVQLQGELQDIGGQVGYINRGNRINYGGSVSHQTLRFSSGFVDRVDGQIPRVNRIDQRIFISQAVVGATYPLSSTRRFEVSGGATRFGFGVNVQSFTTRGSRIDSPDLSNLGFGDRDDLYLARASVAYVEDYATFGMTSPVMGGRTRLELTPQIGSHSFVTARADVRRYYQARPVTFAFMGLHVGNYGASLSDAFGNQFIGFPHSQGFVRGYNIRSFTPQECTAGRGGGCQELNYLVGTHIAQASAEVRVPLLGPEPISLLPFQYVPTEIAFFGDAGIAWTSDDGPDLRLSSRVDGRVPVFSAGVAARFNVLGALILESYYAYPFQRPDAGGQFGLRFMPGW